MKRIAGLILFFCILMQNFLCSQLNGNIVYADGRTIPLPFNVTDAVINPDKPVIYFSDSAGKKLYEVNYENGSTREISFAYPPEHIAFANEKIYVCLLKGQHSDFWMQEDQSGAFAVIDAATFTKISEFDISLDPYSIAADNFGNVYISSGSGQFADAKSYNQHGTQISSKIGVNQRSKILIHPIYNRMYTVSLDLNTFVETDRIDNSGVISYESYKGTFSSYNAKNIDIFPDGKYLFIGFEGFTQIFSCDQESLDDVTKVGSILYGGKNMDFDLKNNRFFICDGSNQVCLYESEFMEKTGTINTVNNINNIYYRNDKLIAVTSDSNNKFCIESIPSSSIVQVPPEENPDSCSVKLRGAITDTVYDGKKAYSVDGAYNHLFITDLEAGKVIKQIKLPYRPSSLCVSEDKTKLYIANANTGYPITEVDISTGNVLRNLKYKIDFQDTESDGSKLLRHIYNNGGKLYLVGNEREPILYVFDEATFEFVSSPAKRVGSMAFSTDKDYFYYWNTITGFLHKYSIDGNDFTEVGISKSSCFEQGICPFDIPLFLNGSDEIICKRSIFKQNDLSATKSPFSEDIYAIYSNANLAIGQTGLYDLKTGIKIEDISLKGAQSFYLDQDRSLIYEKDNILKISMFTGADVANASKISLLRNQADHIGVLGNYSDGRTSDITSKATFETSNANIAQVSSTGLITANNMGTADITVHYGSFSEIVKVEVGLGLKEITLSKGVLSPQFNTETYSYEVILPIGSKTVPEVTALAVDSSAKVSIEPAVSLPGSTKITVKSPDGAYEGRYIIHFSVAEYIESIHPYVNNADETWEYSKPDYNGDLQITFSSDTAFKHSCDKLYITDKFGSVSGSPFTGNELAGKTIIIKGNSFKVRLTSDSGGYDYYGFRIINIVPITLNVNKMTSNVKELCIDGREFFQLKVDAEFSDGSVIDVTKEVDYISGDTSIATVDQNGLITAVANGNTNVTIQYKGCSVNVQVYIIDARPRDVIFPNNFLISQLSKDSASLSWANKIPYACRLEYWTEEKGAVFTELEANPSKEHRITLKDLALDTTYHCRIHYMINGEDVKSDTFGFDTTDCDYFSIRGELSVNEYDSLNNKEYIFSRDMMKLYVIDLDRYKVEKSIEVEKTPFDMTLSDDYKKLYLLNTDRTITVFDTVSLEKLEDIPCPLPTVAGYTSMYYHIYYKNNKLFLVDGEWEPGLWVYDLKSKELKDYSEKVKGIGELVFSSSGNEFYYWYQYGWGPGWSGSNIYKCQIDNSGSISVVKKLYDYNSGSTDIERDPLSTPIFFDEKENKIYCKNIVLDANSFKIINKLPENIYAISPGNERIAGNTKVFRTDDLSVSSIIPKADVNKIFFDKSGNLYMCQPSNWKCFFYREEIEVGVVGDYNGDNEVNSIDFAVLRKYLLGIIKSLPVKDEMYVGDLNRDGNVNAIDFAILRGYLLGTFTELPKVTLHKM